MIIFLPHFLIFVCIMSPSIQLCEQKICFSMKMLLLLLYLIFFSFVLPVLSCKPKLDICQDYAFNCIAMLCLPTFCLFSYFRNLFRWTRMRIFGYDKSICIDKMEADGSISNFTIIILQFFFCFFFFFKIYHDFFLPQFQHHISFNWQCNIRMKIYKQCISFHMVNKNFASRILYCNNNFVYTSACVYIFKK